MDLLVANPADGPGDFILVGEQDPVRIAGRSRHTVHQQIAPPPFGGGLEKDASHKLQGHLQFAEYGRFGRQGLFVGRQNFGHHGAAVVQDQERPASRLGTLSPFNQRCRRKDGASIPNCKRHLRVMIDRRDRRPERLTFDRHNLRRVGKDHREQAA